MAVSSGTAAAVFIHRLGDGQNPVEFNKVTGVTAGADQMNGDVGSDVIFGDAGDDTISGVDGNDTTAGGHGVDRLLGGIGNDVFRIQQLSYIRGLAETVDGGNDVNSLDFVTLGATGRVDLALATLLNIENLNLSNNTVPLTAAQLGGFEAIGGTGFYERVQLSAAGVVDLTSAVITGIDEFRGTSGADNLTGSAGADFFVFDDLIEMATGAARDVITDFVHGQDIIRLTLVDADLNTVGDQQFNFIGGAAFGLVAGQLRHVGGILSGDVDGDDAADFQIALTGTPILAVTDLQL